jgi:hypothetical protein
LRWNSISALIIEIDIKIDIEINIEIEITKHWFQFKAGTNNVIDNIVYQDLIRYQDVEMKIIRGIYLDEDKTGNNLMFKIGLDSKAKLSDIDGIRVIKNQFTFIHDLLLMKDKLKKLRRVRMTWTGSWIPMYQCCSNIIRDTKMMIAMCIVERYMICSLLMFCMESRFDHVLSHWCKVIFNIVTRKRLRCLIVTLM